MKLHVGKYFRWLIANALWEPFPGQQEGTVETFLSGLSQMAHTSSSFSFPPVTHGVVKNFPPLSFNSKCGFRKLEERQMTECQPLLKLILESESGNTDRELHGRRLRKGSPVAGNTLDPLATQTAQLPL